MILQWIINRLVLDCSKAVSRLWPSEMATLHLIAVILGAISCGGAWAKDYVLFNPDGTQVSDYNRKISELRGLRGHFPAETRLVFGNGEVIPVTNYLGEGKLTAVFLTDEIDGLRVPLASGNYYFEDRPDEPHPYTEFMAKFLLGYEQWGYSGATVKVDLARSFSPQYIRVKYFNYKFNLWEFYQNRARLLREGKLKPEDIVPLEKSLVSFSQRVTDFKAIWDFRDANIGSDGNEWLVLDIGNQARRAESSDDPTLFDDLKSFKLLPTHVRDEIRRLTRIRRSSIDHGLK